MKGSYVVSQTDGFDLLLSPGVCLQDLKTRHQRMTETLEWFDHGLPTTVNRTPPKADIPVYLERRPSQKVLPTFVVGGTLVEGLSRGPFVLDVPAAPS